MRNDLKIIGNCGTMVRNIAASATRYEIGEPIIVETWSLTNGAANTNTFTLAATDVGVIDADIFGGVAMSRCRPLGTGTVVAHKMLCATPIGVNEKIRAKAETVASINTAAKLLALVGDAMLINYDSTGGTDGGELYTIEVVAAANTSAFQLIDGDIVRGTLDVWCAKDFYRAVDDLS